MAAFYTGDRNNAILVKCVGKLYRQAVYNRQVSKECHLAEMSKGVIPAGLDEDKIINDFAEAVEKLKEYPSSQAGVYYRLVKNKCIDGPSKKGSKELQYETLLSESMVYRRLREAYAIIGEWMVQMGSFEYGGKTDEQEDSF